MMKLLVMTVVYVCISKTMYCKLNTSSFFAALLSVFDFVLVSYCIGVGVSFCESFCNNLTQGFYFSVFIGNP